MNADDGKKMIKEAFEKKRKRLLDSLKLEKEMQISKLEEDGKIQEKRIIDLINLEIDNMIKTFRDKKKNSMN